MNHISRHYSNDDAKFFAFVRDSKLPRDTFRSHRFSVDSAVLIVCGIAVLIVGLAL